MKILIIGSRGFIGSHCYEEFVTKGYEVHHCDILADKSLKNYYKIDKERPNYDSVFGKLDFDFCINCSGAASVPQSIVNPEKDYKLNVINVFNQLEAIRKNNCHCKYINLSSAAVYGNPEYLPIDELHPIKPISPYGFHKKMAEDICEMFENIFSIKTYSLRVFSCYGEGLKKQLFWDLHQKALKGRDVELFGTGRESRDFIYVKDLINAIDCILTSEKVDYKIINVASGTESLIKDISESFYRISSNEDIKVSFLNKGRPGDPSNWVANIDRIKSLGFTPNSTINEGLKNYVAWLKDEE